MARTLYNTTVLCLAAGALLASPRAALAQKTTFNPSVAIEQGYSSNIQYAGSAADSDTDRRIAVEIPYERETPKSKLRLAYRPSYIRQKEFDILDRDEHRFDLRWNGDLTRQNRLGVVANYTHSQAQGSPEQLDDPNLFLTQRTDRDLGRLDVTFTRQQTARWTWIVRGSGETFQYAPIVEDSTDPGPEDRVEYGATARLMRTLSRTSSLGVRYDYRRFELDRSGDDDNNGVGVTYETRLARTLSLSATLGGFVSRGDTLPDGENRGLYGEFRLNRGFERMRLEVGALHRPSSGGAIGGTSEQTSLDVALVSANVRHWRWRFAPSTARRKPNTGGETIYGYGGNGFIERRLGPQFSLRLRTNWYDQNTRDSVFETGLAFLWYPWGGTALSGIGG